jgi:hypothetical protein
MKAISREKAQERPDVFFHNFVDGFESLQSPLV